MCASIRHLPGALSAGITALVLGMVATDLHAQATLELTTTDQESCVVVTDQQGIFSSPDSTVLRATGVTLTGDGCGGGSSGDFGAAVTAPASATAGTPFNVNWSATSDATYCVYAGSASGSVTGWTLGAMACQGASCSTPHTESVTVQAAGNYVFRIVCTNASGVAEGSTVASVPAQAPQPANFELTAPASATVGDSVNVSWSVSGATSCVGTAKRDGTTTTLAGWTDVSTVSSPRTITFPQAGSYELTLTCSNSVGSVTSQPKTIAVSPQDTGEGCPAGRQTAADVCYHYNLGSSCSLSTDVTQFKNIWGRGSPSDTALEFPGRQGYAVFKNLQKSQYIAARFTVPQNLSTSGGKFYRGETLPGPGVTMSISQQCGDFSLEYPCQRARDVPGTELVRWKNPTASGGGCELVPGQTYYVNLKVTNPSAEHTDCTGSSCKMTIQNNYNVDG